MERVVRPELLDSLPVDHPEAARNRRDLRLLNALMGSHRWLERMLRAQLRIGERVLEIGAGEGDFARRVRRHLSPGLAVRFDGLDRCPRPDDWPSDAVWWEQDALDFGGYDGYEVVVANLLLHQFEDFELAELGKRLASGPRLLIACEPARRRWHLAQLRFVCLFGLGQVTRHDGAVSIRAGFVGEQLPRLLGLNRGEWSWRCSMGMRGQYFMVAHRMPYSHE